MSPQDAAHSGIEVAQRAEGAGDGACVCVWGGLNGELPMMRQGKGKRA